MYMQKAERQNLILTTIKNKLIERQEQLVDLLNEHGFKVTQASISRDLDELNIVKTNGRYTVNKDQTVNYKNGILSMTPAGSNLLILKCSPGFASAIASMIDSINSNNIVGTIAGDDTIFLAVRNENDQSLIIKELSVLTA